MYVRGSITCSGSTVLSPISVVPVHLSARVSAPLAAKIKAFLGHYNWLFCQIFLRLPRAEFKV